MKAEITPGYNKNRTMLAEVIPLDTPFNACIANTHLCNFKCIYCSHSLDKDKLLKEGFQYKNMDDDVFFKTAEQLAQFPRKLKLVFFVGLGEPLIDNRLPDMIAHLTKLNITERIQTSTNAVYLTKEMTHRLVDAGLTIMQISLQGMTSEKYKQITGVDVKFDDIYQNIKYFYENRRNCKLYVKIMDITLEEGEEQKFYDMFGDICDEIYIEHCMYSQKMMGDYNGLADDNITLFMEKREHKDVCPMIFYTLQIDASGNIIPCPSLAQPKEAIIGNVKDTTLLEIWNGEKLRSLQKMQLSRQRYEHPACGICKCFPLNTSKEDDLDEYAERLLLKINKRR